MDELSFSDLISNQYLGHTKLLLPGVGVIKIKQISAETASEVVLGSASLTGGDLEEYISSKALSFVKGSAPTKAEVSSFRKNQTAHTISSIYAHTLDGTGVDIDMDAAEKN